MSGETKKIVALRKGFAPVVMRKKFDYTKWRRHYFDNMSADEFNDAAAAYDKAHPFKPQKEQIPI
ncbi:MAG: hypothetical protein IJ056_01295 [Acidaminococcaceae bacterium]|nr:hypothetical protein [Acidaminococcaceae bacterium]MBQ9698055.1 hypothetical protein [Acidaminococcaceae bacterium]MBR1590456.1 hypothetical protein [Acidaminococcaceae bacterium]